VITNLFEELLLVIIAAL